MPDITTWQILYVDDDVDSCRQIKELLEGERTQADCFYVEPITDFGRALGELEARRYDLVILDVRVGRHDIEPPEEAGIQALQAIQQRRFVPVIFYTGLPHLVQELKSPLVRVVEKTQGLQLIEEVKSLFQANLPSVNRALIRHLETVQRDYMWKFVASHWAELGTTADRSALAYLLARRLAISLSEPGIKQLVADLGGRPDDAVRDFHPMQYYILPPVDPSPLAGDIYRGSINGAEGYWILLSPSCDLVSGREKAEWILFAHCMPLCDQKEYKEWIDDESKAGNLQALLKNNRPKSQPERFFFLPGALSLPDLIVDFQQTVTISRDGFGKLERLASLDSPFAESLVFRFTRYYGRIGTPDLDTNLIINRLRPQKPEAA